MTVEPGVVALDAAFVLRDAAESLSIDAGEAIDRDRYRLVASRLEWIGDVLPPDRSRILEASPYVVERSGVLRTLVEMIEHEPDGDGKFRLAQLLLRALIWHPALHGPR